MRVHFLIIQKYTGNACTFFYFTEVYRKRVYTKKYTVIHVYISYHAEVYRKCVYILYYVASEAHLASR